MSEIYIEVRPKSVGTAGDLVATPATPELLKERIDELGEGLAEIANSLRDRMDKVLAAEAEGKWGLDQVSLKFSMDLETEAGVIIARAKASAGFDVSLTWKVRQAT